MGILRLSRVSFRLFLLALFILPIVSPLSLSAGELIEVFGPKEYQARNRKAYSETLLLERNGQYLIRLENGDGELLELRNCQGLRRWARVQCAFGNFAIHLKRKFTKVKSAKLSVDGQEVLRLRNRISDTGTKEAWVTLNSSSEMSLKVKGLWRTSVTLTILGEEEIDVDPPLLTIVEPQDGAIFEVDAVGISGQSNEPLSQVTVNGTDLELDASGLGFSGLLTGLTDGSHLLSFWATDLAGNIGMQDISITVDTNEEPIADFYYGQVTSGAPATVMFNTVPSHDVDGQIVEYKFDFGDGSPEEVVSRGEILHNYQAGSYQVTLTVTDDKGASASKTVTVNVSDQQVPVANFSFDKKAVKAPGTINFDASSSSDADGSIVRYLWFFPDGTQAEGITVSKEFTVPGKQLINLVVADDQGALGFKEKSVFIGATEPPVPVIDYSGPIELTAPATVTLDSSQSYDPDGGTIVYRKWDNDDGYPVVENQVALTRTFTEPGEYRIGLLVRDSDGDQNKKSLRFTVLEPQVQPPVVDLSHSGLNGDSPHLVLFDGSGSTDPEGGVLSYSWDFGDGSTSTESKVTHFFENPGTYTVVLTVSSSSGESSQQSVQVTANQVTIPPAPVDPAPEVEPLVVAEPGQEFEFLYQGTNPVQVGVLPNIIEGERATGISGQIFSQGGLPLSGVKVKVKDKPEYGHTFTRVDGQFDLVYNGGEMITLEFVRAGHLSASRNVSAVWNEHLVIEPVVLVPFDEKVSRVEMSAPVAEIITSSVSTDSSGSREVKVLVPSNTSAKLVMANGSQVDVDELNIRMTEYTVGENGPNAMPAELPANSGYTYAVELSADEAVVSGAESVEFSQPLPVFITNFLNFPVGEHVPVGYLDRQLGKWLPSKDGLIIGIVGVTAGLAEIDLTGDTQAASQTDLDSLGVSDDERRLLAQNYTVGDSLWRVPVTHFTPFDTNWPFGPPPNSMPPPGGGGGGGDGGFESGNDTPPNFSGGGGGGNDGGNDFDFGDENEPPPNRCEMNDSLHQNSVIEIYGQVLREDLYLQGLPVSLHYRSDRVEGYARNRFRVQVTTTSGELPVKAEVIFKIAGREQVRVFENPGYNEAIFMEWDGLDRFGRTVYGSVQGRVTIRYTFDGIYYGIDREEGALVPLDFSNPSFGSFSPAMRAIAVNSGRQVTRETSYSVKLEKTNSVSLKQSFGGWTPSTWHSYRPDTQTVYLGDGRAYRAGWVEGVVKTVAGRPLQCGSDGDGVALETAICTPEQVEVGGDGSIYFTNPNSLAVEKVTPDGQKVRVVGNGTLAFGADGTQAINSGIPVGIRDIKIAPNGDLYLLVASYLKRIDKNGLIWSVTGDGTAASTGDGGPAINAQITSPLRIALDTAGNVYLAGSSTRRIRRINAAGTIDTINNYQSGGVSTGDGGSIAQATFTSIQAIATGPNDELYITDGNKIRKVSREGIITTIAGDGQYDILGDGVPAISASFGYSFDDLAVDPITGWLYVSEGQGTYEGVSKGSSLRRILGNGNIETVLGSGTDPIGGGSASGYNGDGLPGRQTLVSRPAGVAFAPNGDIVFSDRGNHLIRKIVPAILSDSISNQFVIPSQDGSELFVFNRSGLHLETRSALTGGTLLTFEYDANNLLVAQINAYNQRTEFQRDGAGGLQAIVSPEGRSYSITRNIDGWVDSVSNPKNETFQMEYHGEDGLLREFRRPLGGYSRFSYDLYGKLTRDENSEGGFFELVADSSPLVPLTRNVQAVSSEGSISTFEYTKNGNSRIGLQVTTQDGTQTGGQSNSNSEEIVSKTGTRTLVETAPDPRFGMTAPYNKLTKVTLPSGLEMVTENLMTAVFSGTSLTSLTFKSTENGLISQSVYTPASGEMVITSPLGRTSTVVIDSLEKPTEQRVPGITPVQFSYTQEGRLDTVTQGVRSTSQSYYANGFLESVTNSINQTTYFDYDAVGRLTQTTLPDGRIIGYRYDDNGNIVGLTPPGRAEHGFVFNSIDYNTGYHPPLLGAVGTPTTYEYDTDKKLTAVRRPDGKSIIYGYNPSTKRLNSITTSVGQYGLVYNGASGQLRTLAAPGGENIDYSYDGHLLESITWSGTVSGQVEFGYDNFFRTSEVTVNGNSIAYGFDDDGLLVSAGDMTYTRDPQNGLLTSMTIGNYTDSITYNAFGEVETYTSDYIAWEYERDNLGRITKKTETISGTPKVFEYRYDNSGRLDEVKEDGVIVRTYQFDSNGNRLSINNGPQSVIDSQDRLISDEDYTYVYNLNGDLESKTHKATSEQTLYNYDEFGNLRTVTLPNGDVIEYVIDSKNRRIGEKRNETLVYGLLYEDSLNPVALLNPDATVKSRFVYGSKINVPEYMVENGETYKIVSDHLGSVRFVVKVSDGTILQEMEYDEFGMVTKDTNPGFQPFGYAGGLYSTETNLVRFGARDYSPETGRWTSKDPIRFEGGQANLFVYVKSDPVNNIDPSGLVSPSFELRDPTDNSIPRCLSLGAGVASSVGAISLPICLPIGPAGVACRGAFAAAGGAAGLAIALACELQNDQSQPQKQNQPELPPEIPIQQPPNQCEGE